MAHTLVICFLLAALGKGCSILEKETTDITLSMQVLSGEIKPELILTE